MYRSLTIILIVFSLFQCDLFKSDSENRSDDIYISVYNDDWSSSILRVNYFKPSEFELVFNDSVSIKNLRVSPDGKKVIYSDLSITGYGSASGLALFDLENNDRQVFYSSENIPLVANESLGIVWNNTSNGFYFTNPIQSYNSTDIVYFYDLILEQITPIKHVPGVVYHPINIIDNDKLLVYSNDFDTSAYYLMDLSGNIDRRIDNPYLELVIEDSMIKRTVWNIAWNDSLQLLAATLQEPERFEYYKIIVTDLNGEYYKEFTDGRHRNLNPVWADDGKIIFRESRDPSSTRTDSDLKILDINTEQIKDFFTIEEYSAMSGVENATNY
jgi:Tol biopolymer transport system component